MGESLELAVFQQMKFLILAAWIALTGTAAAQGWPTRPITLIVPFAPSGGVDVSARIQAQQMGELLGQPIVTENLGAAAGMVGSARVAKAEPDGYTFSSAIPARMPTPGALQEAALPPGARLHCGGSGLGVAAHSHRAQGPAGWQPARVHCLRKGEPEQDALWLCRGRLGTHLPCLLFNRAMGIDVTHVPYRGAGRRCRT